MHHKTFRLTRPDTSFFSDSEVQLGCGVIAGLFVVSIPLAWLLIGSTAWSNIFVAAAVIAALLAAVVRFAGMLRSRSAIERVRAKEQIGLALLFAGAIFMISLANAKGRADSEYGVAIGATVNTEVDDDSQQELSDLNNYRSRVSLLIWLGLIPSIGGIQLIRWASYERGSAMVDRKTESETGR